MSLGDKMFTGAIWSGIERVALKLVTFLIGILLARLLTPTEYGTVGLLVVFLNVSQVFIDSGFAKALIQKKERNQDDYTTVFLFNLLVSLILYCLFYFTSPFIASFYDLPILVNLLRVMALTLIVQALFSVPLTMLTIAMNFKKIAKINLSAVIISGLIAIYLAYYGYGVWALVWQTVLRNLLIVILVFVLKRWVPKGKFSIQSFKQMFSFGYKLLISNLLSSVFTNLNALLIGKYLNSKQLGLYSRGIQFSDTFFGVFDTSLSSILLPGLAPHQDNKPVLVDYTKKIMKMSAIVFIPIFFGLSILAKPIILVLLTDKWALAIPIMQIYCVSRLITLFCGINNNILYVIGRTDLVLRQQYYCIAIRVILVIAALKFGILYIALAELVATISHFFIQSYYPGKLMSFGSGKQLKALSRIFLASLIMLIPIVILLYFVSNLYVQLIAGPLLAIPAYYLFLKLFKVKELDVLVDKIVGYIPFLKK